MTSSTYFNTSGVADIRGFEVGVEFLAAPWLRGFANYSYQDTKQSITGSLRRGRPTSMVKGGFNLSFDNGLNGNLVVHYVGDATYPVSPEFSQFSGLGLIPNSAIPNDRVPSYTLVNLRGGYWFWNKQAEVAISVFNTFKDQHRESPI